MTSSAPRQVAVEAGIVLATNLWWENAHGALYDTAPLPGWRYLRATLGDLLLVAAGHAAVAPMKRRSARVGGAAGAAALTILAVAVERHALKRGRWGYLDSMPTVKGIGVSPLIQLPITGLTAAWLAKRLTN